MPQGWGLHAKPSFFFIIFSGGLYFGALNLELFQIGLVTNLGVLEKKRCFLAYRGRGRQLAWLRGAKNFTWWD